VRLFMACNNCGQGTGSRHGVVSEEREETPSGSVPDPYDDVFKEMNQYSFDTLLSMKRDVESRDLLQFRESRKHMSDDLKALQVLTFVRVFNGEEFSPHGHNPKFCIWFLHRVLAFPEMDVVNLRFPSLKEQVAVFYEAQSKERLVLG